MFIRIVMQDATKIHWLRFKKSLSPNIADYIQLPVYHL